MRTAAEHATEDELRADMMLLLDQWEQIAAKAAKAKQPTLLYREPELAVRVIREEFNADYRGVVIDDRRLHERAAGATSAAFNPELADRVEFYDPEAEGLSLFEHYHVHEQVHKALDRKVWLPSGGSLIIEHTEALTVIDVNTGKNVGTSNLEETVFHNNMEAADEIAKQLRLRDIGGIIVIDFIDMEIRDNRAKVVERVPQRAGPRQDPLPGVRHLRPRPRRDDPQAHRRGPAHRVLRDLPQLRRPRRHRRPRAARLTRWDGREVQLGLPIAMYAVIGNGAGQDKVEEGQRVHVDLLDAAEGDEVTLTAKMVVDGDTVLATPDQLDGCHGHGSRRRRGQGPEDQRVHVQEAHQPAPPVRPPPALHASSRSPRSPRSRRAGHVEDQGWRLHPQRP